VFDAHILNVTLKHTSSGSTMRFISDGTMLYSNQDLNTLHDLYAADTYHWFWSEDNQLCMLRNNASTTNDPDNCTVVLKTGMRQIRFNRFPVKRNQLRWVMQ
jgi:hypothetical protein